MREAVFVLSHESDGGESRLFSPVDQIVEVDVRGEILSSRKSVKVRPGEAIVVIIGPESSMWPPVMDFRRGSSIIYGDPFSLLEEGEPLLHP